LSARCLDAVRSRQRFFLSAWVFVPNHWHAILFPPYPITISEVMKSVKLTSTNSLGRFRGETGELWQGRFFDHALRTVRNYWETVEYIHLNPVRRGLVTKPQDWI
jgi:putative transposase